MTGGVRLTRRRAAAVALLAVTGSLVALSTRAGAQAPSAGQLPDFGSGAPYQDSAPQQWAFEVTSGGMQPGQTVRFSFLYNGSPGDRSHAVSFAVIGNVADNMSASNLPTSLIPTTHCIGTGNQPVFSAVANPYTQSIDLQLQLSAPIAAGTTLVYCFNSNLVGFPLSAGSGYSIAYTEPGGTVSVPYTAQPQPTGGTTQKVTITDSGSDITDAGLGGSRSGVYAVSYTIALQGRPSSQYFLGGTAFDTATLTRDADPALSVDATGTKGSLPTPGCTPGGNVFCTDAGGTAPGTLTITSKNPNPDYVVLTGALQAQGELEPSAVSITVGLSGAVVTAPTPTPLPTAGGTPGGTPPPSTFNVGCNAQRGLGAERGLGGHEFYDLYGQALLPAATTGCSVLSSLMSFYGVTDELALQTMFSNPFSPFSFVGIDRALSSTEETKYTPTRPGGNTISQIPVSLEPVVVTYNLNADGCSVGTLKLRSQVLSAILIGKVTRWNDSLITADNLGLSSCNLPILVAHDIGVTSSLIKDYLSKRVPAWTPYRQPELSDSWPGGAPVACTANGSRPMSLCVSGKPGMLGYGFYRDIVPAGLPVAAVDNPTTFWAADSPAKVLDGCTAAAGSATAPNPVVPTSANGDWSNASLTDTALPNSYPICTFDFVVAATQCTNHISYQSLIAFLDAALSDYGQQQLAGPGFARLPGAITTLSQTGTNSLTC